MPPPALALLALSIALLIAARRSRGLLWHSPLVLSLAGGLVLVMGAVLADALPR